ncbi:MAG: NAD-dependent epimerase/dehydratase family protein [Opitutales bacterium]
MSSDRRLLILGCGYVGRAVAEAAQQAGWSVAAVTRNPETAEGLRRAGVDQVLTAALDNPHWADSLETGFTAALYAVSASERSEAGYRKAYVDLQRAQASTLQRLGVSRYLYTGSTGIYPQSDGEWVGEKDAAGPDAPGHAGILAEAENVAGEIGATAGSWRVLRLAGIYGPGRTYFLDRLKAGNGVMPGYGDYFVNWIHRDDIAAAAMAMLNDAAPAKNGAYNVADGKPALRAEIAEWAGRHCGIPEVRFEVKAPGGRSGFRRGQDGRPPNRRISNARLRETFGWQPRHPDFRSGYADLV